MLPGHVCMRKWIDTYSKVQFTMAFCTYVGTVQVVIALLKFYMQTALLSHDRNVSGSNTNRFWHSLKKLKLFNNYIWNCQLLKFMISLQASDIFLCIRYDYYLQDQTSAGNLFKKLLFCTQYAFLPALSIVFLHQSHFTFYFCITFYIQ